MEDVIDSSCTAARLEPSWMTGRLDPALASKSKSLRLSFAKEDEDELVVFKQPRAIASKYHCTLYLLAIARSLQTTTSNG